MVIDGKTIASEIIDRLKTLPKPEKFLAGILVGDDPASLSFLMHKKKVAEQLGVDFRLYTLDVSLTSDDLRREVGKIAAHATCGGVLVELPLPPAVNRHYVLNAIPPQKDVDVMSERTLGAFYLERSPIMPPVASTTEEILKHAGFTLKGKRVAIVGTGFLIGRPIVTWLMNKVEEIFVVHKGSDFSILKKADLIILGTGKAGLINAELLKEGAGVIDFGYGKIDGVTKGDFDDSGSVSHLSFYTPVPGGAGPILIAKLYENFYILNGGIDDTKRHDGA